MPRRGSGTRLAFTASVLAGIVLLLAGSGTGANREATPSEEWAGLLGGRSAALLGDRYVVLFRLPSLADRVRGAGGRATEAEMREFTAAARESQARVLFRLALRGVVLDAEQRYVRVVNGVSASLDEREVVALEAAPEVRGVWPVRASYPAALTEGALTATTLAPVDAPGVTLPGFRGTGVTVAVLDTGVDVAHPFLGPRLLPGIDVVDPAGDATAREDPTTSGHTERHGTELAGVVAGAGGPRGLRGVASGASILPIRVAGWQPDAGGGVSVYSRTDQLLAGLEAAVDPNVDGDAHDAARIALIGVNEPFAAFEDGPLARAVAGATALDTLVVAPAGNDGAAGPSYGSIGGPGGSPAALTVGAVDTRGQSSALHVLIRSGLDVLVAGAQALASPTAPNRPIEAPLTSAPRASGLRAWFDDGFSLAAGKAVLLPRDVATADAIRDAATAGARIVLVDGDLPAGSLGPDATLEAPVFGVTRATADRLRSELRLGRVINVSVGAARIGANAGGGKAAPFTSQGLALAGSIKPEVAAAGVGVATSSPGRGEDGLARYGSVNGSSASAAVAAGVAALLAEARPDLDAVALKSALVTASRPLETGGDRLLDVEAAAATELVVSTPTIGFGATAEVGETQSATIVLRNVSTRRLRLDLRTPRSPGANRLELDVRPKRLGLAPGASTTVRLTLRPTLLPRAPGALRGTLVVRVRHGAALRLPWAVAIPVADEPVVTRLVLSRRSFAPSDTSPAVISFVAGRIDGSVARPNVLPLTTLTVDLVRAGRRVGTLVALRDVLPGRYAIGLTGRNPSGARLPPGTYAVRVTGRPASGGRSTTVTTTFSIVAAR
jgi:hypothetical protein